MKLVTVGGSADRGQAIRKSELSEWRFSLSPLRGLRSRLLPCEELMYR